jgi:UDP-glucose 4-epimerase
MKQFYPSIKTIEDLEDNLNLPAIYKVLDIAAGIKIDGDQEEFIINGADYATEDGTAVRDYTHVWDIARAHINALEYLDAGGKTEYINIGAGQGKSVVHMMSEFMKQANVGSYRWRFGPRREGDIPINYADITKAKELLGWEPKISDAYNIVKDATNWYRSDLYKELKK